MEIEKELPDMAKTISTNEKTLDVKVEPTIDDLVVVIPTTTSHNGEGLDKNTKGEQSSEAVLCNRIGY